MPFDVAIVAIARDEAAYVEEWIAYHSVIGVEHFFIYDNDSTDDLREVLRRYVNHGLVTLVNFPMSGGQVPAYAHAIHFFGGSTRWLAPLDLDEFIVPKVDADLPSLLARLGDVDRVVVPWRNFGFSGHRTRPAGLVIENFVMAEDVPDGGFAAAPVKSIVRSSSVQGAGVHTQSVSPDRTVDAAGDRPAMADVRMLEPTFGAAQINHYVTKSEEEFARKVRRGQANRALPRRFYTLDDEQGVGTEDRAILPFVEPTRRRLRDLRSLSDRPYRYGSQVELRVPHPDPFVKHASLAVSNYLHGMRIVRNATKRIENVAGDSGQRAYLARADGCRGVDAGRLAESPHFSDLVRRLEGEVRWRGVGDALDGIGLRSPAVVPISAGSALVHVAIAAVVEVAGPTEIHWSIRGDDATGGVVTALPGPGRFACVVEANRTLARADAAVVAVDTADVSFDELVVLTYG